MTDLCTLTDVKAWLSTGGPPGTLAGLGPTDDPLLARLITAVSAQIENWLCRPILSADWQETRDGLGGPYEARFQFGVTPCMAVLAVSIANIAVPAAPAFTPGSPSIVQSLPFGFHAGYEFSATQLVIRGYAVPRMARAVSFTYTGGYPSVPADIAQAAIDLVVFRYRERTRIGAVSARIGGEVVSYSQLPLPPWTQLALQQYRAVAPISGVPPQLAPTQTDPAIIAAAA